MIRLGIMKKEEVRMIKRQDGRAFDQLRPIKITTDFVKFAEGYLMFCLYLTIVVYAKCSILVQKFIESFNISLLKCRKRFHESVQ